MIDNFVEYMWYLLTTPLKKIKKKLNKWYIFCRVFGRRFDEVKEDILRARDEGMVATCSHVMLQEHARDRGIIQYKGEDMENFRKRIALHEDTCRLAGTNEGIILAVKSLGYEDVVIKSAKEVENDDSVWAEFYVTISMEESHPIGFDILCKEVRQKKEVGAKDNYMFITNELAKITAGGIMSVVTYTQLKED